ncbi:tRNA (cytosine(32)/uridine(32)-2'-O)-methyltransferase TrmJ [Marinobacteraceae bacterium S3BR75-40.1]
MAPLLEAWGRTMGWLTALDNVRIVLVETSHPGNIGATARAMKNMGLRHLTLVSPREFPAEQAVYRASGATDVLEQARVVSSLDDAIEDCVLVIGASARMRSMPWPVLGARECAGRVLEQVPAGPVALLFGRESSGLSNDELHRCHYHMHIPTNAEYSSLNLAMAVQLMSYELRMAWLDTDNDSTATDPMMRPGDAGWDEAPATVKELEGFLGHLEQTLVEIDFHDPQRPRQLMTRLRRLFQRTSLDRMEVNILRGILRNIQRRVGTAPDGQSKSTRKENDV